MFKKNKKSISKKGNKRGLGNNCKPPVKCTAPPPYHLTTRKMLLFPAFVFKTAMLHGDSDVIPYD